MQPFQYQFIDPAKTVSFTGYRPEKIRISDPDNKNLFTRMQTDLLDTVHELAERGDHTFLSGMAEGFDLMAARAVLLAKNQYPSLELICVIPFPQQSRFFADYWKREFDSIKKDSDYQIIISDQYGRWIYHRRNDFLFANCSVMVCYYDGQRGGTHYTLETACKHNREIINLCKTPKADKALTNLKKYHK